MIPKGNLNTYGAVKGEGRKNNMEQKSVHRKKE